HRTDYPAPLAAAVSGSGASRTGRPRSARPLSCRAAARTACTDSWRPSGHPAAVIPVRSPAESHSFHRSSAKSLLYEILMLPRSPLRETETSKSKPVTLIFYYRLLGDQGKNGYSFYLTKLPTRTGLSGSSAVSQACNGCCSPARVVE